MPFWLSLPYMGFVPCVVNVDMTEGKPNEDDTYRAERKQEFVLHRFSPSAVSAGSLLYGNDILTDWCQELRLCTTLDGKHVNIVF